MASARDYATMLRLDGQVLLVVGGGAGMGRETCRALGALGAHVVLIDRHDDRGAAVAAEVGGVAVIGDATEEATLRTGIDRAVEAFGRIDGAIDILGRAGRALVDDLDLAGWREIFRLNLDHAYVLARLLAPRLAAQGGGSLTFVSSVSARYGAFPTPAYVAAKSALNSLVRTLAATYGPSGVRANTVSPGVTLSDRMVRLMGEDGAAPWVARTALKRVNDPSDVAAAIAFLVSPAARTITGHDLVIDGGTSVRDPYYGDRLDSSFADDVG